MPRRARTVSRQSGATRRRFVGAALAGWSLGLQGCYESLPLQTGAPPAATRIEFVLNDQGRAALEGKLGPAIQKVEGEVVNQDAGSYEVAVYRVTAFNGDAATWTGEHVKLAKDQAVGYQVRRLNKVRSGLLIAGVVAGIVVVFFGKALGIGGGSEDGGTTPEPRPTIR